MRWLLSLYPSAWRTRYEAEVAALLAAHPPSLADRFDLLRGALDAHLHPRLLDGRVLPMVKRLRTSETAVFFAFMLFGIAWLGIQRVRDPLTTFNAATSAHPEISWVSNLILIGGLVAFLAVLAGGVPVLLAALRSAIASRSRAALLPFALAIALVVIYSADAIVTAIIIGNRPGVGIRPLRPVDVVLSLIFFGFTLVGAIVGPVLIALVVARGTVGEPVLRFAMAPALVATAAMTLALAGTVALDALMSVEVPATLANQDVGAPLLALAIAMMAVALLVAVAALTRGLRGGRATAVVASA